MDITTDEIVAAWPRLDEDTKRRVYIAVLEQRIHNMNGMLSLQDSQMEALRHEVEVLEQAVKMPEGYARTNHSTAHEEEFMNSQLSNRQPNEWEE